MIKNIIIATTIFSAISINAHSHLPVSGSIDLGYSKFDMAISDESLNMDLDAVKLGLRLDLGKNYFIKGVVADVQGDFKEYEADIGYERNLNERVGLYFSLGYHVHDIYSIKDKSSTVKFGTKTKLNKDVSLNLGLERFDRNIQTFGFKDVTVDYVLGLTYNYNNDMSFSIEHRDVFKETGIKATWHF